MIGGAVFMKSIKNHTIKYLALLMMAILFLGIGALPKAQVVADETEVSPEIQEELATSGKYALKASNDNLAFYVESATGHFAVVNKKANSVWYSIPQDPKEDKISKGAVINENKSELVVEYMGVNDVNTNNEKQRTNSQVGCVINGMITVESIDNGVTVLYEFDEEELGFKIPVKYVLHEDYLETSIDLKNLDEGDKCILVSIKFLPTFGAANPSKTGYLFVPDGSGAIAGFNRGVVPYQEYNKTVYGNDMAIVEEDQVVSEEDIRFPVFGSVIDGAGAMMGVITEGDGAASIIAKTGSSKLYYNTISSQLMYRIYSESKGLYAVQRDGSTLIYTLTETPSGLDSYTVRYYFLDGEEASYVGMAKKYREYLVEEKSFKKNLSEPSLALNIYGSIETPANILGITYDKKRELTTFAQAQKMLEELKSKGVNNITLQYIGWNNNGVFNRYYPDDADALSILGGNDGFEDLVSYLNKNKVNYYFTTDFLEFSEGSLFGASAKSDATKAPNGDVATQYQYSIVTYEQKKYDYTWVYVRPDSLAGLAQDFLDDYKDLGLDSIGLSKIGSMVYSDFDSSEGTYRSVNVNTFADFLSKVGIKNIAIDGGNAYALPYSARVFEAPMTSSNYDIFDYDVPFYQMVLHGYINYTTPTAVQTISIRSTFLKCLETGSDMLFSCVGDNAYNTSETRMSHLYSSQYSLWKDEAIGYYKEYSAVNAKVYDKEITDHAQIAEGVYKTVYSNGVTVYVNYNREDVTVGEMIIGAENYVVKEAA